ncbi:YjbE family putative metal transport protein [Achromobacter xylosoxidans]
MEFLQSLEWGAILKIIGIDIMLGVDNAIVIALACAALPAHMRRKAVLWGTAGAVGLRAILLVFAGFLMGVPYIKAVAGAYLLYLGYKLLVENDEESHAVAPADRVWTAVKTILIADFMMSLDNVLAVAGAAESAGAHSTLYAIAGIVLSIPVIIFGATGLMGIMKRFPVIVWVGGGLLGWVGVEMVITDIVMSSVIASVDAALGSYSHLILKAVGFAAVVSIAYFMQKRAADGAAVKA